MLLFFSTPSIKQSKCVEEISCPESKKGHKLCVYVSKELKCMSVFFLLLGGGPLTDATIRLLVLSDCYWRASDTGSTKGSKCRVLKNRTCSKNENLTGSPGRRTGRAIFACCALRAMFRARTAS